jgi:GNAT superfamily N-acetyltransferase
VRPATAADEAAIAALAAASGGRGWWGREQRVGPDSPDRRRHVEVEGDQVIGYGAVWRRKSGIFGLDTLVHPGARGHGVGRRLVEVLFEDLAELGARAVEARIDADHLHALTFMARRGFTELNRLERTRLDLATYEPPAGERVAEGVILESLGDARAAGREPAIEELLEAAFRERPIKFMAPFTETPLEKLDELAHALPHASFVARAGDAVVGFTGLGPGPEEGTLSALLTAVAPAHRGRGLATALKRRAILNAKQDGARAIVSHTPNRGMQDLNELLGFVRTDVAEIRMGRRL